MTRTENKRPPYWNSTSGFQFGHVSHLRRSKAIGIPNFDQISSHGRYFLFPVSENKRPPYWKSTFGFNFDLFAVIGIWFSIDKPNFVQIGSFAAELWRRGDFQDGGRPARQPCWIWFRVMVDHPQSVSCERCLIIRFRLDRIYSFEASAIFIFWHFGLKLLAYSRPLLWGFGVIFPQMTSFIVLTPKGISLRENTSSEAELSSVKIGPTVRPGYVPEKKSQMRYISPTGGEAPTKPICTEICTVVAVLDVIMCGKFWTEILRVTVLQEVEFPIFLLILSSALQQRSANALPVMILLSNSGPQSRTEDVIQSINQNLFSKQ